MDSEYQVHRLESRSMELSRLTQVLRETFERRFRPDEAVESAIDSLEVEIALLKGDIRRK